MNHKSYVILGTININNYYFDDEDINENTLLIKLGSVRHNSIINRLKQLKNIINIKESQTINITEYYENKIHKILRTNPFTEKYHIKIDKIKSGFHTEYYIYNKIIHESIDFLIKNITFYYNNIDLLNHLLTKQLTILQII